MKRLKDFEGQRIVVNYSSRVGVNDQLCKIMFVGQESVIINLGRKELRLARERINYLADVGGERLLTNRQ